PARLVALQTQTSKNPVNGAVLAAASEEVVDAVPFAVALWDLAPLGVGMEQPDDAVERGSVVVPLGTPVSSYDLSLVDTSPPGAGRDLWHPVLRAGFAIRRHPETLGPNGRFGRSFQQDIPRVGKKDLARDRSDRPWK